MVHPGAFLCISRGSLARVCVIMKMIAQSDVIHDVDICVGSAKYRQDVRRNVFAKRHSIVLNAVWKCEWRCFVC